MCGSGEQQSGRPAALVSACLLGHRCRHDGGHKHDPGLESELERGGFRPVPFCPEEHGGLGTPRPAAWLGAGGAQSVADGLARVVDSEGHDVTAAFLDGARGAVHACRQAGAQVAYLKERSPSCGVQQTYIAGRLSPGCGLTAHLLGRAGIEVHGIQGPAGGAADPGHPPAE